IGDVKSVDGRTFFRADARERDRNVLVAESGEQFVEKAKPIRCLDLDERVSRMRLIFHGDACGKTETEPIVFRDAAMSALKQRREIEIRIDQRGTQRG